MASERRLRSTLAALSLVVGLSTQLARAQPDAGTRVAARELAVAGAEAFEKQDYGTALDRFQRAESLYKVPSIAVMTARCLARLGRLVEAIDKYEETLRMPLDPGAPEAFQRAVRDAATEVEQTRARVARLELRPPVEPVEGLEIALDGKPVPKALWSVAKPVDPGVHRVTARAPYREPYAYEVTLVEGARRNIEISMEARAVDPAAGSASGAGAGRTMSRVGIGLLAGGGVALAAGAVTGIIALNRKSELDDACKPACPPSMSEDIDGFRRNRTLSYVGFGVGLAAAGLGTYFLLHGSSTGERVEARVFPSGAAVTGRF